MQGAIKEELQGLFSVLQQMKKKKTKEVNSLNSWCSMNGKE
jgi:hypothetical protein